MTRLISVISLLFFFISLSLAQEYFGPIPPISSGYGAFGSHNIAQSSIENSMNDAKVTVFYPEGISTPVPTILYCHGYGIPKYQSHLALVSFIVSKGYAVVYSPYPSSIFHDSNNNIMLNGFIEAAQHYPDIIDTSQIGLMGHSYGAGAIPWVGKSLFSDKNWGSEGKFMFLSAAWFIRQMTQEDLESFPSDCKLIIEVNEYDKVNDHRMSIDLFCNINIPLEEKDFILVPRDTITDGGESYIYPAAHNMIGTIDSNEDSRYDAQDYYAIFRLLDALCLYTFDNDLQAKNIALGNGNEEQISMGNQLKPLIVSDYPQPILPEEFYDSWPCHTNFFGINPRIDYCDESCPEVTDLTETNNSKDLTIYPNPVNNGVLNVYNTSTIKTIQVFDMNGILIQSHIFSKDKSQIQIDMHHLEKGIYFIQAIGNNSEIKKIIVI